MANTFTTPFMNMVLPLVGVEVGPDWATELNNALNDIVDSHNHTSGNGVQIPTDGILINANLSMNVFSLIDVKEVLFQDYGATSTNIRSIYPYNGDLYYNNSSGVPVQITSGSGLNLASAGSIGGDYGQPGIDASVIYTDLLKLYTFYSDSGVVSDILIGSLIIAEPVVSANTVTISSPTSLAASYEVTMFTALPSVEKTVRVSSAGQLIAMDEINLYQFKANGAYGAFTLPATGIDQPLILPFAIRITDAIMHIGTAGSGGTTELDIKYKPAGSYVSIFTTTPKVASTAGDGAVIRKGQSGTGLTAPVLTSDPLSVSAYVPIRLDVIGVQTGDTYDAMIELQFERVS